MSAVAPCGVVILNDFAAVNGGSTAVAIASATGLALRGVPVTLFTGVGPVAPELHDVPNLTVICLGEQEIAKDRNRLRAVMGGWGNARAVRRLREVLARLESERTIVHAHTWTKALSPQPLQTAADLGFPLVVTLHDFFIACPNGGFFAHRQQEICPRTPLSLSCWACNCDRRNYAHKLWRNVRTVVQNRVLHVPDKVSCFVGVSDHSLNLMRRYLPSRARTEIVRNPVDCVPTPPMPVGENRRFVFVGRLEIEKGALLFAEAARAAGVPATFVGDGALRERLRDLCPKARFTGWLDRDAIREELRSARALVFPPLWYETLGLVVIEAAAAGVPAIVSDRCAATDHIRDGVNGLHFRHGQAAALRDQLLHLAGNDTLATRLGEAAHAWYWRDPWTRERHVDDLLEIYRTLLRAPKSEPVLETADESTRGIGARG